MECEKYNFGHTVGPYFRGGANAIRKAKFPVIIVVGVTNGWGLKYRRRPPPGPFKSHFVLHGRTDLRSGVYPPNYVIPSLDPACIVVVDKNSRQRKG